MTPRGRNRARSIVFRAADTMSNVLRLAIVDPDDSKRESLKIMLLGMDMIWLEAECSRYEFFADVVAQTNPDIGLVALDSDPEKAMDLVTRLSDASPNCAVLVTSSSQRRQPDPPGDAGRRQGIPHAAGADRRPAGRVGPNQRTPHRTRREPPPRQPGHGRGRRHRRRGQHQPGREPGLRAGQGSARTRSPWSISTSAWATPTCSSTPFPTTRWSTSPRTSRGWTSAS